MHNTNKLNPRHKCGSQGTVRTMTFIAEECAGLWRDVLVQRQWGARLAGMELPKVILGEDI